MFCFITTNNTPLQTTTTTHSTPATPPQSKSYHSHTTTVKVSPQPHPHSRSPTAMPKIVTKSYSSAKSPTQFLQQCQKVLRNSFNSANSPTAVPRSYACPCLRFLWSIKSTVHLLLQALPPIPVPFLFHSCSIPVPFLSQHILHDSLWVSETVHS